MVSEGNEILDNHQISDDGDEKEDKRAKTAGIIGGIVGGIVVFVAAGTCWENSRRKKKTAEQQRRERERELAEQGKVEE